LPTASASSSDRVRGCEIWDSICPTTRSALSPEELLAFPGYVMVREESIPRDGEVKVTQTSAPVDTMIIVDDDAKSYMEAFFHTPIPWSAVYDWAYNLLEGGDDPFNDWFSIDFVASQYRSWNSPSGSLTQLLQWGQQAFPKPVGIDVTFILTGQNTLPEGGRSEVLGDAFIMSAWAGYYGNPLVNVWQHEASHLYHAPDHSDWWSAITTVCIMSYFWCPYTRNWCGGCSSEITSHKYRFGSV